jgi:hypothetical protein
MQPGCSYCSSKVTYHLKGSKRTGVNFSRFYSTFSARHEKGYKKGNKKGAKGRKKGAKRATVSNPNSE